MGKTQYLYCDGTTYTAGGGQTVQPSRDSLVYGTYIPGIIENTVGTTGAQTTVLGAGGTTYTIPSSATEYNDTRFESYVSIAQGTGTITFRNCLFVGNNPQDVHTSRTTAAADLPAQGLSNFTNRHLVFIDCTFDNGWWFDQGLSNRYSTQWSPAIHGGHFTLERCEVKRFTDLINFAGRPNGSGGFVLIEASRLHQSWYGPSGQEGGYAHADSFQFNTGPNVEVRYSYLGGDYTNPTRSPVEPGFVTPGSNNAIFMIQQELDGANAGTANWLVENFYIHDNWLHGGDATINLNNYVSSDARYNPMPGTSTAGCRITANRFAVRDGVNNKAGTQIRRTTSVQTYIAGNYEWVPGGNIYGNGVELTQANGRIVVAADE